MCGQLIITMHIFAVCIVIFFCSQHPEITKDFLKLRNQLEREVCKCYSSLLSPTSLTHVNGSVRDMHCVMQGLFKVKPWYFVAMFAHIVLLDVAAWLTLRYFSNSWGPWLATAIMFTTSQARCTRTVS